MKKTYLLPIIISICMSCSFDDKTKTNEINLNQLKHRIDSLFNSKIAKNEPGAAIAISYNNEALIKKGFGLRDLKNKKRITPNTNMRIASVSKQFTALCILDLIDKKKLKLTDSLSKFWNYPVFKNITVQHLLNHTSGIANFEASFEESWDRSRIVENKDVLNWLIQNNPKPLFIPGSSWEYSNTAYLVLANLVEKVSGQEFSAYAKENIFEKAGMKTTNFYCLANPIHINERAYCYEKDSLVNWNKADGYFMNGIMGDGAVYTNLNDYLKYDQALRNKTLLSETTQKLIFKPSSIVRKDWPESNPFVNRYPFLKNKKVGYAMGWFVTDNISMHSGGWHGTRTTVIRHLDKPLTIVLFMNSNANVRELAIETYEMVEEYFK